jgi:hypothetical protein
MHHLHFTLMHKLYQLIFDVVYTIKYNTYCNLNEQEAAQMLIKVAVWRQLSTKQRISLLIGLSELQHKKSTKVGIAR